jgi:hypothetical protein
MPGFHFNKMKNFFFKGNDVNFLAAASPITRHYRKSFVDQEFTSHPLTVFSLDNMQGHGFNFVILPQIK